MSTRPKNEDEENLIAAFDVVEALKESWEGKSIDKQKEVIRHLKGIYSNVVFLLSDLDYEKVHWRQ